MVQSFSEERQTIETHFSENFDSEQAPVKFDNVDFLLQGNTRLSNEQQVENTWVRLNIQNDLSNNVVVGNKRVRNNGAVVISVFTRENQGTNDARDLVDQLVDVFNNQTVNGISFSATSVNTLPATNGWYSFVLTTDYYWDRCI